MIFFLKNQSTWTKNIEELFSELSPWIDVILGHKKEDMNPTSLLLLSHFAFLKNCYLTVRGIFLNPKSSHGRILAQRYQIYQFTFLSLKQKEVK